MSGLGHGLRSRTTHDTTLILGYCAGSEDCYYLRMNLDRIRERLRNGFKPFAIEVSSGKRYDVPHPEFFMIGKSVVAVLGKNDSVTTIDALHITAIKDLPLRRRGD